MTAIGHRVTGHNATGSADQQPAPTVGDERQPAPAAGDERQPAPADSDKRQPAPADSDGRRLVQPDRDERQEYLAGGLAEVRCEACGLPVRAGKRSAMQTSVQWSGPACDRLAEAAATAGRPPALVPTCPELRASIDRAVREGRLEVS